ncbi:L,D-transpeptidase-like protein [Pseudonocardia hierapolitana]|uniref:L,D-transpeptidase-like protein n=1 Tax=Pseudonocardia hierapolitana TaxID=1128676 RepID=A0A561T390_9PSEU|nr:L,D-transpeptidase [Pseudonocardia hierapolitana]TWF81584.1 L,D-transpeptidase-like protein [Pseudonocardia hierapolitana]
MGRSARRPPVARVAVGALAAVVATGLLGLGYAQANPQPAAPDLPATTPVAGPARPVERTHAAEPGREADADDGDRDSQDADSEGPGRLRAAAPPAPRSTPRRAAPPPEPSQPAGSKPTPHPTPPVAPSMVAGTPCTVAARACVALGERLAWLLDDGKVVRGPVAIQHGDAEDPTPLGTFAVQWKAEQYTSREYLTQMPYSVFFADGGIAFHEGTQDTPSAGCVKLDHENAKAFFYYLQVGDEVQIH